MVPISAKVDMNLYFLCLIIPKNLIPPSFTKDIISEFSISTQTYHIQ